MQGEVAQSSQSLYQKRALVSQRVVAPIFGKESPPNPKSHQLMGNKWSKISKNLDGRTDNAIKNHWNSIMRKKLTEFEDRLYAILKAEQGIRSKTEALDSMVFQERELLEQDQRKRERKYSSKSTMDEEPSPKTEPIFDKEIAEDVENDFTAFRQVHSFMGDRPSSPIIKKSEFDFSNIFDDISFSSNVPSYISNAFFNRSVEVPFDIF